MLRTTTSLVSAFLVLAAGLPAQDRQTPDDTAAARAGQQMMMPGMMGGMMGAMDGMAGPGGMMGMMGQQMAMMGAPGPGMLLRMRDALELTDDQVSRLEALQEEVSTARQQHMQPAMTAHRSAMEALQGEPADLQAYEESLREAAQHMVQAHVEMARFGTEAHGVLTPEQRQQLQEGMRMMRGMMDGPMMRGDRGDMMRRGGPDRDRPRR